MSEAAFKHFSAGFHACRRVRIADLKAEEGGPRGGPYGSFGAAPRRSRRGFASVTAVVLIGLLGLTLGAMLAEFSVDYRRTQRGIQNAQLRQMLLAGSAKVIGDVPQWGAQPPAGKSDFPLPQSLADQKGSLEIEIAPAADNSCDAKLTAHLGKQLSRQTLHFSRAGEKWSVQSASLVE